MFVSCRFRLLRLLATFNGSLGLFPAKEKDFLKKLKAAFCWSKLIKQLLVVNSDTKKLQGVSEIRSKNVRFGQNGFVQQLSDIIQRIVEINTLNSVIRFSTPCTFPFCWEERPLRMFLTQEKHCREYQITLSIWCN